MEVCQNVFVKKWSLYSIDTSTRSEMFRAHASSTADICRLLRQSGTSGLQKVAVGRVVKFFSFLPFFTSTSVQRKFYPLMHLRRPPVENFKLIRLETNVSLQTTIDPFDSPCMLLDLA